MTKKHRIVVVMLSIVGLLSPMAVYADTAANNELGPKLVSELNCVVTAYYQPTADQKNFEKGSWEADVALNGDDTTADGTKVQVGTVAAPPEYPFGTIIDIDGFGVGVVHDRGGAIKGNRFDIWVGKGDEGLGRALNWGKRTTTCKVYLPGSAVPGAVKEKVGTYNLPSASLPASHWESKLSGGHKNLSIGEGGDDVTLLRKLLNQNGYVVVASGEFDSKLEKQVIAFQLQQKIITTKTAYGAGIVGPRTWQALLAQPGKGESSETNIDSIVADKEPSVDTTTTGSGQVINAELAYGAEGAEVSKLQENLRILGYFDSPTITGYFGPSTKAAIIRFQLKEKLVDTADAVNAGEFNEITKERMLAVLLGKKTIAPTPVLALKKGSKGAEVQILQEKLQKAGMYVGPITDFYGEQTAKAVSDFQAKYKVQLANEIDKGTFESSTANRLDQVLGLDISLSPSFIRYIQPVTLEQVKIKKGN